MSTDVSRRQFLKISAVAGGGLILGFELGWQERAAGATAFEPNAWIRVRPDGTVTFVCPRNEMGQDVYSSLTMLLAEELAVDPGRITVEQAPTHPAYVNNVFGVQITSGSTSVRDAWNPLRKAGAATRIMLIGAAAEQWNVSAANCRAENGHVLHGSKTLSYGALAASAARQPLPTKVPLRSAREFRVIGKPLPRLDGADKARGS